MASEVPYDSLQNEIYLGCVPISQGDVHICIVNAVTSLCAVLTVLVVCRSR